MIRRFINTIKSWFNPRVYDENRAGDVMLAFSDNRKLLTITAVPGYYKKSGLAFIVLGFLISLFILGGQVFEKWISFMAYLLVASPFVVMGLIYLFGKRRKKRIVLDAHDQTVKIGNKKKIPTSMIWKFYIERLPNAGVHSYGESYHLSMRTTDVQEFLIASGNQLEIEDLAIVIRDLMDVNVDIYPVDA